MPCSVIIAVIRSLSVTSKAGLYTPMPSGAIRSRYHMVVTSSGERCSITMSSPVGVLRSMVEVGAHT